MAGIACHAGLLQRTFLARVANLRVLWVSSAWLEAGVMVAITATLAPLPLRLLHSRRVSLESRKGTCAAWPSLSLEMTVPRVSRLRLMKAPSLLCPLAQGHLHHGLQHQSTAMSLACKSVHVQTAWRSRSHALPLAREARVTGWPLNAA